MKPETQLTAGQTIQHVQTGRKFEYLETVKPQFFTCDIVYLRNLQTGKIEQFASPIYKQYFEII